MSLNYILSSQLPIAVSSDTANMRPLISNMCVIQKTSGVKRTPGLVSYKAR
jgi:hypothetical protein